MNIAVVVTTSSGSELLEILWIVLIQSHGKSNQMGKRLKVIELIQFMGLNKRRKIKLTGLGSGCNSQEHRIQSLKQFKDRAAQVGLSVGNPFIARNFRELYRTHVALPKKEA